MTEPKNLPLVNEQLRRSNRFWKALALAACSALVLVVLFGFVAVYTAQMRANRELRAANAALARAHQARVEAQWAANPGQPRGSSITHLFEQENKMKKSQIFISYSRHDRELVERLAQLLRIGGTRVFRDEESIAPGQKWQAVISQNLEDCQCVLVCWSLHSAESAAVKEEYYTAIRLGKAVVPLLLDRTPVPKELSQFQWIDCTSFVVIKRVADAQATAAKIGRIAGTLGGGISGGILSPLTGVLGATIGAGTAALTYSIMKHMSDLR